VKNIKKIEIEELAHRVIGMAIEVHKELGPGLLESTYQACLLHELLNFGYKVEKEKSIPVKYKGMEIDCGYRIDMLIEKKLVIELKSVNEITSIHLAQTLTYLKLGNFKLGLLINFNEQLLKNGIKRVINS
jgi:GxxExxY protein